MSKLSQGSCFPRRRKLPARSMLLGGVLALSFGASSVRAEQVVIGAQYSLSGPAAAYAGPNLRAATEIAVEHVNQSQLLGSDRTLRLVLDDNGGTKTQAIALISKQANADNVVAILGPQGSDLALPAAPVANSLKVAIVTMGGSAAITDTGPWSFILLAPSAALVKESIQLAADKLKIKTVGVVFNRTNDSSVGIKNAFEAAMKAHGIKVVASEGVTPEDTNFGPLATKLASTDMDALYIELPPASIANVIIQVKQAGLDPEVKILSSMQASSPQFIKVGGEAVNGIYYPVPYLANQQTPENKYFVDAYRKRMGTNPDALAALGYNGAMMLASAIKVAGPGADRDKVRMELGNLHDVPSVLGTGRFSFGKDRAPEYSNLMVQLVDGKEVAVPLD